MTPSGIVGEALRVRPGARPVLDVRALEVRPGQILAVIGPNGVGSRRGSASSPPSGVA